jgi:hypothetical protein
MVDSNMSLDKHINNICKVCFMYLRAISRQKHYLTKKGVKLLTEAYVISRLNYCVSLLYGISTKQEQRLQRIINYSVRLVNNLDRRSSTDIFLHEMGWLPIRKRILWRICIITYVAITFKLPKSIALLLNNRLSSSQVHVSTRSSNDRSLLFRQRTRTKFGDKAFRVASVILWNVLPNHVRECTGNSLRTFKNKLWQFVTS